MTFSIPQAHGADQTYTTGTQNGVVATGNGDTISILGNASVGTSFTNKAIESAAEDVNVIINTTGHVSASGVDGVAIVADNSNASFDKITITDGLVTSHNISGGTTDPSGTIRISGASAATEIEIGENGSVTNTRVTSGASNIYTDAIYIGDIPNRSATEYDITITNAGNISTQDNHHAQAIRHLNETGSTDSDLVVSNTGTISAGSSLRVAILHETINGTGDFIVTNSDDGVITGKLRTYASGLLSVTNSDTARILGNIDSRVGNLTVTNSDTAHIEGAVYTLASGSLTVNNADSATLTGTITTESGDLNLNVLGGTITGNVTSHQGDVDANISGGSVLGYIKAIGEMDISLTGGSVTGDVSSTSGNVIASLDGGDLTGNVTSTTGTVDVTLADGAIEGDISASGKVDVELTGGSVTGDVSSSSGNVIASLDGGDLTGNVTSTTGTVDVTLADGTLAGDISASGAVDVELTGGSINGNINSLNSSIDISISDGSLDGNTGAAGNVKLVLSGGSVNGRVSGNSSADVSVTDGTLEGDISSMGDVIVAVDGGSLTGDVSSSFGKVDVSLADGSLEGDISTFGEVDVAVSGGSLLGDISGSGNVQLALTGGSVTGDVTSTSSAVDVSVSDGALEGDISSSGNLKLALTGGSVKGKVTSTSAADISITDSSLEGDIIGTGNVNLALNGGSVTGNVSSSSGVVDVDLNGGDLTGNVNLGIHSISTLDLNAGSMSGNIVMGHEDQVTTFNGGAFEGTITGSGDGLGHVVIATGVNQTFTNNIGGAFNDIDKFSVQSGATATLNSSDLRTEQEDGEIALDVDGTLVLNAATSGVSVTDAAQSGGGTMDIDGTLSVIGSNNVNIQASSGAIEIDDTLSTLLTNSATLSLGAPSGDTFSIGANSNTTITAGNQIVTTSDATLGGSDTSTLINMRRTDDFDPRVTSVMDAAGDVISVAGPLTIAIDDDSHGFTYGDAVTIIDSNVDAAADYATLIANETIKLEYGDDVVLRFVDNGSDAQDLNIIVDVKDRIDGASDRTNEVLKNAVRATDGDPQARSAILALSANETNAAGYELLGDTTGGAATTQAIAGNMMSGFDVVSSRLLESRFSNERGMSFDGHDYEPTFWLRGFGTTGDQEMRNDVMGYRADAYGIMAGGDVLLENEMRVGLNASYAITNVDTAGLGNHEVKIDTYRFGVYAGKQFDFYYIEGQANYAYNDINTSRDITFGGLDRTAIGQTDGYEIGARLGAGIPIMLDDAQTVTPYTNFQYIHAAVNAFTESGAGGLNVHTHDQDVEIAELAVGARYDASFEMEEMNFKPVFRVAASYDFIGEASQSTQQFTGGGAIFTSPGADVEQFSVNYGAGVSWEAKDKSWEISLDYDGKAKSDFMSHGARYEAKFRF